MASLHPRPAQSPLGRWLVLTTSIMAVLVGAYWLWALGGERRALLRMEPAERASVFARTSDAFRAACLPSPPAGLHARCRSMAEFLRYFPECTTDCRNELEVALPPSTR